MHPFGASIALLLAFWGNLLPEPGAHPGGWQAEPARSQGVFLRAGSPAAQEAPLEINHGAESAPGAESRWLRHAPAPPPGTPLRFTASVLHGGAGKAGIRLEFWRRDSLSLISRGELKASSQEDGKPFPLGCAGTVPEGADYVVAVLFLSGPGRAVFSGMALEVDSGVETKVARYERKMAALRAEQSLIKEKLDTIAAEKAALLAKIAELRKAAGELAGACAPKVDPSVPPPLLPRGMNWPPPDLRLPHK